jgi:hypothetical protein
MFLNTPVKVFDAISNSSLTSINNELYENGIRIATQTDIDTLQGEIDSIVPGNPNALVTDQPLVTPSAGSIIFSDGVNPFGTNTDSSITYTNISKPILTVGAGRIVSDNNNMELESTDYILTKKDFYLQGTEDVQRYLTVGCLNQTDNVKTYVDINTADYICDNQLTTKTQWKNASEYDFDNDVKIGDITTTKKLYLNDVEITPSSGVGVTPGMLRALNLNLLVPTVAQTYDVVWSNLTPTEQLIWKGGDAATIDPIQSATGNYWNFTKSAPSTNKINWTIPIDLSALTFQELQSVWAIVRFNNSTSINAEGQLWFQIQTNPPTGPNFYRTRWNYSNSATPINQFQYFYKIHALDTITTTTAANLGRGQDIDQQKFKGNPCDVEPNLWSIGFNKLVVSPTGDTTAGYTQAPILSVALNTASNIHTYNFDVVAIGVNNIRYNLFYA